MGWTAHTANPLGIGPKAIFLIAVALVVVAVGPMGAAEHDEVGVPAESGTVSQADPPPDQVAFPLLRQIHKAAVVRRGMFKGSAVLAKIFPGAVIRVQRKGASRHCPNGWMERQSGGYVCSKFLHPTEASDPHPAPRDRPDLLQGLDRIKVIRRNTNLYRTKRSLRRKRPYLQLLEDSTLVVQRSFLQDATRYYETRGGWYVEAEGTEVLPLPPRELGIDIDPHRTTPLGAIVVTERAPVFSTPDDRGEPIDSLNRWEAIYTPPGHPLEVVDGFVRLAVGRYARDRDLARVRPKRRLRRIGLQERWLAVDVREQLVHAYEGDTLVRVMPCSTGKRGNTKPGRYRIQWKRRMQTMQLKKGRIRVEDVQWVMYYHRQDSIAIHSAYWHNNFGRRHSHGCVNLPPNDARFVFEWTTPYVQAEDSERFPAPGEPGSRVIVFKD